MKTDYVYPEISCRRSANEWQQASARDIRISARERAQKILSEHYPNHISSDIDEKIRKSYSIILPRERMTSGNGVW